LLGYHKFVTPTSAQDLFSFNLPVYFSAAFSSSSRRKTANTDAFIKAIYNHPVSVLVHPSNGIDIDVKQIAKAAKDTGVYFELNGKKITLSRLQVEEILNEGADLIANSDAHSAARVGEISTPLKIIDQYKIPLDRIANWGKIPLFRSLGNKI